MEKLETLLDQTGNAEFRKAASKPEQLMYGLIDEIETKSQRLNLHFRGHAIQWD
jgi:hypothetical protein